MFRETMATATAGVVEASRFTIPILRSVPVALTTMAAAVPVAAVVRTMEDRTGTRETRTARRDRASLDPGTASREDPTRITLITARSNIRAV